LRQALDARDKIPVESKWYGHPKWEEFQQRFAEKECKFYEDYDRIEIEDMLKSKTSHGLTLFQMAVQTVQQQGLYQGVYVQHTPLSLSLSLSLALIHSPALPT
jgi:hypothetical protein